MTADNKIITTLRERRQIEGAILDLLACASEVELKRQAQGIAARGSQVIPVIVGSLDRADNRLLVALGTVASYLDHDQVVLALRQAALQPGRTDRARLGAMTILERFLGELPGQDLFSALSDPQAVVLASLDELLAGLEADPAALVDYIQGLDHQQPDVVLAVVHALQRMEDERAVEVLRLIAQDVRAEIAAAALQALGGLVLPAAAAALQTLVPAVGPDLAPLAERMLLKLQFKGVPVAPLPPLDAGCRALIAPPEGGSGRQIVWFLRGLGTSPYYQVVSVLLSDQVGAIQTTAYDRVLSAILPSGRQAGQVHTIEAAVPGGTLLLLEAPFDLGRRLLGDALALNRQTQIPLPGPLRLAATRLWDMAVADGTLPAPRLPQLGPEDQALDAQAGRLLASPALALWRLPDDVLLPAAEQVRAHLGQDLDAGATWIAAGLLAEPDTAPALRARLMALTDWLMWAGDEPTARLALAAALALNAGRPAASPFLRAMIRRDLERVLGDPDRVSA